MILTNVRYSSVVLIDTPAMKIWKIVFPGYSWRLERQPIMVL